MPTYPPHETSADSHADTQRLRIANERALLLNSATWHCIRLEATNFKASDTRAKFDSQFYKTYSPTPTKSNKLLVAKVHLPKKVLPCHNQRLGGSALKSYSTAAVENSSRMGNVFNNNNNNNNLLKQSNRNTV